MPDGAGTYRFFRPGGRDAAAGGRVLMPPTTMGPSGRMAMVADPGGAAVGVWQADQHIGAGVVDEPGAMTWWEVNTRAFEACKDFYGQVFGWDAEKLEAPGVNHATWKLDGRTVGGMLEMNEQWEGIPSSGMVYVAVAGTDEAASRATELGGPVGARRSTPPSAASPSWSTPPAATSRPSPRPPPGSGQGDRRGPGGGWNSGVGPGRRWLVPGSTSCWTWG
jgi:predicted enzyme related to lactoylglutathione lyase